MCFEHFAVGRLKALVGRYDQSKLVAQKPSSTQPILVSISIMGGSWIWCCIPASDSQQVSSKCWLQFHITPVSISYLKLSHGEKLAERFNLTQFKVQ